MKILSLKDEEFYEGMGKYFVTLCQEAGYGKLLTQLGKFEYIFKFSELFSSPRNKFIFLFLMSFYYQGGVFETSISTLTISMII